MGELRIATIPDDASAASGLSARVEALLREDPEVLAAASAISILPTDVLAGLHLLAAEVEGSVLEIGPYQGGSTAAIASGLPAASRIVTVEVGGGNPTHGDLPTDDTLVSLAANLERLGLVQRVDVVQGWSHALTTRRLVAEHLRKTGIGLLVIDADLDLDDELGAAAHWMRERCLLVINHYLLKAADGVHDGFRASLDNKVAAGVLRRFAVLGGGTWFGQVNGPAAVATLRAGHRLFRREEGECHSCFLELPVQPDDTSAPMASTLELFEGERPLGPPHCCPPRRAGPRARSVLALGLIPGVYRSRALLDLALLLDFGQLRPEHQRSAVLGACG